MDFSPKLNDYMAEHHSHLWMLSKALNTAVVCIIATTMKYFNKNKHHLISEDRILEIRCFLFTILPHGKSLLSPDKLVIWVAVTDLGLYSIQQQCLMEQYPSWLYCSHPNGGCMLWHGTGMWCSCLGYFRWGQAWSVGETVIEMDLSILNYYVTELSAARLECNMWC